MNRGAVLEGVQRDECVRRKIAAAVQASLPLPLDANEIYALPAIVWAEALVGVRMASSGSRGARRLARLEAIRRVTGVVDFNPLVAEHYADIFTELSRKGKLIPQNDIAVAATARAVGFGVLVAPENEMHFRRVRSLTVKILR